MISKKLTITNPQGFHMRPAGLFANTMAKYDSDVTIFFKGNQINGKSIMNIIAASIKCGSIIEINCSGPDEEAAMKEAEELITGGFGE